MNNFILQRDEATVKLIFVNDFSSKNADNSIGIGRAVTRSSAARRSAPRLEECFAAVKAGRFAAVNLQL